MSANHKGEAYRQLYEWAVDWYKKEPKPHVFQEVMYRWKSWAAWAGERETNYDQERERINAWLKEHPL